MDINIYFDTKQFFKPKILKKKTNKQSIKPKNKKSKLQELAKVIETKI